VHTRVLSYKQKGLDVCVFVLDSKCEELIERRYEGVTVITGSAGNLEWYLATFTPKTCLIHFVNERMIDAITRVAPRMRIIVWLHGFEAMAWHRKWFNFMENPADLTSTLYKLHKTEDAQRTFMRQLLVRTDLDLTFVFVSQWFQRYIVEPDLGVVAQRYVVIPNNINTDRFRYIPKDEDKRFRILSIRSYARKSYANDLTVRAIELLAKRPYFRSLRFDLYGEGPLFQSVTKRVAHLDNVHLHERFLTQQEIQAAHRESGIFLCPTRFDTHGVSMCEAMSSGLVPVSNRICAIPEFIEDGKSGLLAAPEDAEGLAEQIHQLVENPHVFCQLSEGAATRIREVCSNEIVSEQELSLIAGALPVKEVPHAINWAEHYRLLETQLQNMTEEANKLLRAQEKQMDIFKRKQQETSDEIANLKRALRQSEKEREKLVKQAEQFAALPLHKRVRQAVRNQQGKK
ncbi:MAG: glycosyltransferase, partial [Bacilli bacterium]